MRELQPRTLYSARLSFKIEGKRKNSSDKQKLKEFITTKLTLKEMLKGPQGKRKGYNKKYLSVVKAEAQLLKLASRHD